jgi:uncharacterized membrane-anchored protein YhcB (DUF1043 family)
MDGDTKMWVIAIIGTIVGTILGFILGRMGN